MSSDLDLGTLRGHVELDVDAFERKYGDVDRLLTTLERRQIPDVKVDANVTGAEAKVGQVQDLLNKVDAETATAKVDADTSPAESALNELPDVAKDAGEEAGTGAGQMVLAGLNSIPIAGAVVGIGAAIGVGLIAGIKDGLKTEASRDLFGAQTGLDEETADRFGRAAGEAYADAWGESVEGNLDAARTALQGGLLDADSTQADAERMVASLSAVSTILEEDMTPIARATGVMLRTGMASDAQAAFDILVRGAQTGANMSEDLLDTFTEYPALFEKLGLDGETALGLINQGLEGGARNSDLVADALKEFQIRATDASEASAEGFEAIGLNAEEMTAKIARGGPEAKAGLDEVLDGLREMEDPVARNVAGVQLFGTQWEDLGESILALDVTTAVEKLGEVEGATARAMDRLGSNDQAKIDSAVRNVELAADGIKGALASAFSDEIAGAADWVARNRRPMMEFMLDVVNGAFDLGGSIVTAFADGTRAVADFIGGPAADLIMVLGDMAVAVDGAFIGDQGGLAAKEWAEGVAGSMRDTGDTMTETADRMEEEWGGALDEMQDRSNTWLAPEILTAGINDAILAAAERLPELSAAIDDVEGTVTINGNPANAEDTLVVLEDAINTGGGFVTIDGETVTAEDALDTVLRLIGDGEEDVTIDGNTTEAKAAREEALAYIRAGMADVTIGASVNYGDVDNAIANVQGRVNRSMANMTVRVPGFDEGGYTGDVPTNQVAGVTHGREFVFDADTTSKYRPLFEQIHAGVPPMAAINAATPGPSAAVPAGVGQVYSQGPLIGTVNAYGYDPQHAVQVFGQEVGYALAGRMG